MFKSPWFWLIFENIVLWCGLILGLWEIAKVNDTRFKYLILITATVAFNAYRINEIINYEKSKEFYEDLTLDAFENCPDCMNKTYQMFLTKKKKGKELDLAFENLNSPERITSGSEAVTGVGE